MTLTLHLNSEAEVRLRRQAAAAGTDVESYASQLIERATAKPALDELLAPLRRQFADSGATDEELLGQIAEARADYRGNQKKTA